MDRETISMAFLLVSLAIFSSFGNAFVIGIIARYKRMRTFPNILLSNLSLADFLNAFINMPLFFLYAVKEVSWFKVKVLAIVVLYFSRLFTLLHLISMLVLLVNIFLALTLSSEVYIRTRSLPASLSIQGQVTKYTTQKWPISFSFWYE